MTIADLLVIYLACGAPFSVHYFLQNRTQPDSNFLWLKTFLHFLFWMPFAFILLRQNKKFTNFLHNFDEKNLVETKPEEVLQFIQKQIEKILSKSDLKISIYEFREIIGRYIGLTIVKPNEISKIDEQEKEIFRALKIKNVELGAICIARRNRKRLSFHQTEARRDFLHLIKKLFDASSERIQLEQSAIELVNFLKDPETRKSLEKMFADSLQSDRRESVKKLEKDLWTTETPKPLPIKPISIPLQAMTATANLRKKD